MFPILRTSLIRTTLLRPLSRPFSSSVMLRAEGDTGSLRHGGSRHEDTWSRREKAAEDLYIHEREKAILQLLREKVAMQEQQLAKDRAVLEKMEDQYGKEMLVKEA